MIHLLLIKRECRFCGLNFYVCRRCYRGQAYCSDFCRIKARRKRHKETQRKYRQTAKGKKSHSRAENRRRERLKESKLRNMDDQTTTSIPVWCMLQSARIQIWIFYLRSELSNNHCCHFCGCCGTVVDEFTRRPYGRPNYLEAAYEIFAEENHYD